MNTRIRLKHKISHVLHRNGAHASRNRRIMKKYFNNVNFTYFGRVDQYDDDHKSIRGFTASPHHIDDNYAVGTHEGYDIRFVERSEIDTTGIMRRWLIIELELASDPAVSHMFLQARGHMTKAFEPIMHTHPNLQPIPLGTIHTHTNEFIARYDTYSAPSQFVRSEQLLEPIATQSIATHFWPLSIELRARTLTLYSIGQSVNEHLIATMVKDITWLARHVDSLGLR